MGVNNNYENNKDKKEEILPSMIKNKEKRLLVHAKLKHEKKLKKCKKAKARDAAKKRALGLGEELPLKKIPRTIENTREFDETVYKLDDEQVISYPIPFLCQDCIITS